MEVRISQEDLVVLSFPGPDRSISLDQLRAGKAVSRRYRNRRIGEFLKELELTEGRSTGISKIVKTRRANGFPEPEFETDEERNYFLVRLLAHPQALKDSDSGELATGDPPQATPQVARLLSVLQTELGRDDLQTQLGLSDRKYFRKAYLNPAILSGLVEMTIPDQPNNMNQKYRLTEAGRRWCKEHHRES